MNVRIATYLTLALGFIASLADTAHGQKNGGAAKLGPYVITPTGRIDETQFLMNYVANIYQNWPADSGKGATTARWVTDVSWRAQRLEAHAKAKGLDRDVLSALAECQLLFKRYEDFLVEIGAAERQALQRAQTQRGKLLEQGAANLFDRVGDNLGREGGGRNVAAGTLVDALAIAIIDLFQQTERDAAKRASIRRANERFLAALASNKRQHADLMARLNVFATSPLAVTNSIRVQRDANEKAADIMRDAHRLIETAKLVPESNVYDSFRSQILARASELASLAASRQWHKETGQYGSALAKDAVRICRTRLVHDSDPGDWGKYDLSQSLHFAGFHREALDMSSKCTKLHRLPGIAYDHACLLSIDGDTRLALDWLTFALKNGHSGAAWARQDPDFQNLRKNEPKAFTDLLKLKWHWDITFGVLNDDVILTNDSAFPLTNIEVNVTFPQGNRRTARLTLNYLAPGQSYRWVNVLTVPNGSVGSATLLSNQD